MAEVRVQYMVNLELMKPEFTLITKALVGKLRPEEVETAKQLGLAMMKQFNTEMGTKADAAEHALKKAEE